MRIAVRALLVGVLMTPACVHHPRRAELGISSKQDALDRCSQALRRRFANVFWTEADRGLLSTDSRFVDGNAPTRCRAYVALTPGEFGWDAEITVVEERLVDRDAAGLPAAPRWKFSRCDDALEAYLASECARPSTPTSMFGDVENAGAASAPSRGSTVAPMTDPNRTSSMTRPSERSER